jgi:hypothetical protein
LPALEVNGRGNLANSQCLVENPTVSASGNTLTLTMTISFPSSFNGNRVWYLAARDGADTSSDWEAAGSWTVQ